MACARAIHVFVIFCTVYPTSVPLASLRAQLSCMVIILAKTSDIPYRKISTSNVDGLVIGRVLARLLLVNFSTECEYLLPMRNVTGQCPLLKSLQNSFCTRRALCLYVSTDNDTRMIRHTCSVQIYFRTRSGILESIKRFKE